MNKKVLWSSLFGLVSISSSVLLSSYAITNQNNNNKSYLNSFVETESVQQKWQESTYYFSKDENVEGYLFVMIIFDDQLVNHDNFDEKLNFIKNLLNNYEIDWTEYKYINRVLVKFKNQEVLEKMKEISNSIDYVETWTNYSTLSDKILSLDKGLKSNSLFNNISNVKSKKRIWVD